MAETITPNVGDPTRHETSRPDAESFKRLKVELTRAFAAPDGA